MLPLTFLPWVCQIFAWQAPWAHQLQLLIVWSFQYWRHKLLPQEYQDQNTTLEPTCITKIMIKAITRKKKDALKLCWPCSMTYLAAHCWKHVMEALGQLRERITQKKTYFTFFTRLVPSKVCTVYVWTINALHKTSESKLENHCWFYLHQALWNNILYTYIGPVEPSFFILILVLIFF